MLWHVAGRPAYLQHGKSNQIEFTKHFRCPIDDFRPECEAQVKGFTAPVFKKFKTTDEAEEFVLNRGNSALLLVSKVC